MAKTKIKSKPKAKKLASKKPAPVAKKTTKLAVSTFLKVGQKAPAFTVPSESGEVISLRALKGKMVILYFYPKDHTPGCTQESCDFRDSFSRLKSAKVLIYGVSRDSISSHQKFIQKLDLPFSLLADESGKMCEAYGVWKEKNLYGRKYMGIERTTVVISPEGKVMFVYPKVSVKGHVDQILEDLKTK